MSIYLFFLSKPAAWTTSAWPHRLFLNLQQQRTERDTCGGEFWQHSDSNSAGTLITSDLHCACRVDAKTPGRCSKLGNVCDIHVRESRPMRLHCCKRCHFQRLIPAPFWQSSLLQSTSLNLQGMLQPWEWRSCMWFPSSAIPLASMQLPQLN
jgi:hypothetical protein